MNGFQPMDGQTTLFETGKCVWLVYYCYQNRSNAGGDRYEKVVTEREALGEEELQLICNAIKKKYKYKKVVIPRPPEKLSECMNSVAALTI